MRKSRDWWRNHYDNWVSSKLSIGEYSNNNGIKKSTFYGWIKKFRKEDSKESNKDSKVQWATLKSFETEDINEAYTKLSPLKIVIGKASVEIDSNFDPELLNSVVKVLLKNAG